MCEPGCPHCTVYGPPPKESFEDMQRRFKANHEKEHGLEPRPDCVLCLPALKNRVAPEEEGKR